MEPIRKEDANLEQWKNVIRNSRHPVAITGAGISVASGLPTVKEQWRGISLQDFFKFDMFATRTEEFFQTYRKILAHWLQAVPNQAHLALAKAGFLIITQNIDGLHKHAGSRHVLELHGNLQELICRECSGIYTTEILKDGEIPRCPTCQGILKPNIVLVGEEVLHYSTAVDWVGRADFLLITGTKLEMAPCKELPAIAERNGVPILQINKQAEVLLPQLLPDKQKILYRT